MEKRDPKRKGDIAELRCMAELLELGFIVAPPIGENSPYDVIVDTGEKLARCQIKGTYIDHGKTMATIGKDKYCGKADYFLVYDHGDDAVYCFPVKNNHAKYLILSENGKHRREGNLLTKESFN